jgi:hypothetical protein
MPSWGDRHETTFRANIKTEWKYPRRYVKKISSSVENYDFSTAAATLDSIVLWMENKKVTY